MSLTIILVITISSTLIFTASTHRNLSLSSYSSWQKSWSPTTNTDLYVLRYCYIEDDLKLQFGESVIIINVILGLLKQRERYHSKDNPKFSIHISSQIPILSLDHNKKRRLCKAEITMTNLWKERTAEVRLFTRSSSTQTHTMTKRKKVLPDPCWVHSRAHTII